MKHIKNISSLCTLALVAITLTACFKFDDPPRLEPAQLQASHTISQLKVLYAANRTPFTIREDIIIAGIVVSCDREGNFNRDLFIQDETGGIRVKIGRTGLHNFYKIGQTLFVKCRGLDLGAYGGMVEVGYRSVDPRYETGFIEVPFLINRHIFSGIMGTRPEPKTVTIAELTSVMAGTLVKLENLTFHGTDRSPTGDTIPTWAFPNPPNGAAPVSVSQIFRDNTNRQILVRTSGYARFAGTDIPTGAVDLIGIYTVFNNTNQLIIRSLADVVERESGCCEE